MNVRINAAGYNDKVFVKEVIAKGKSIEDAVLAMEAEVIETGGW